MVYIKNYIFNHFYQQYLVLLTMVPRNSTLSVPQVCLNVVPHPTLPHLGQAVCAAHNASAAEVGAVLMQESEGEK